MKNTIASILFIISFAVVVNTIKAQSGPYCIPNRFSNTPLFSSAQIKKDSNLVYAVAKRWNANILDSLRMDVFYPDNTLDPLAKRPFILFIHGGGFLEGNRADMIPICIEFAKMGYVTATITYRLGWTCLNGAAAILCFCPDNAGIKNATYRATQDARAALRYFHAKAADFRIDTNYFFIGGGSAGAITALNTAYVDQAEADSWVAGGKTNWGLLDTTGNSYRGQWKLKGILNSCGGIIDSAFIQPNELVPTISFHDDNDCMVPFNRGSVINCTGNCYNLYAVNGSNHVHKRITNLGGCSELNHVIGSNQHCGYPGGNLLNRSACFFKSILCNTCASGENTNVSAAKNCDNLAAGSSYKTEIHEPKIWYSSSQKSILFELEEPVKSPLLLFDLSGRLVYAGTLLGETYFSIATQHMVNGIYFLKMEMNGKITYRKVMVY